MEKETGEDGPCPAPDFILRFAALMHDIGKPKTRKFEKDGSVSFLHHEVVGAKMVKKRMRALRFDNDTIKAVARLVELHMRFYGYRESGWTDSAVRRYVRDAGDQLERLHRVSRSDVTTRNRRLSRSLAEAYDDLERRIAELAAQEELDAIRPDLDGGQIMQILGIAPGPVVGEAYKFLLNVRLDEGSLPRRRRRLAWCSGGSSVGRRSFCGLWYCIAWLRSRGAVLFYRIFSCIVKKSMRVPHPVCFTYRAH